jgi:hypothetical protein
MNLFGAEPSSPSDLPSWEMRDRTRVSKRSIRLRISIGLGFTPFDPELFGSAALAYEQAAATASPLTMQFWHGLSRLHLSL